MLEAVKLRAEELQALIRQLQSGILSEDDFLDRYRKLGDERELVTAWLPQVRYDLDGHT